MNRKLFALHLLRRAFMGILFFLKRRGVPYAGLYRYLAGKGGEFRIEPGTELASQLLQVVARAWREAAMPVEDGQAIEIPVGQRNYPVAQPGSTWRYPDLFYLVGGFTTRWEGGLLTGRDVYDWHPNPNGEWNTLPLPNHWLVRVAVRVLMYLFGEEWFRFEAGLPVVSDKLWADMEAVGAKSFTTTWEIPISLDEITDLINEN